ncbi:MAG: FIST N-terminal domain-containing protein [Rhodocyclaceae bacterium]
MQARQVRLTGIEAATPASLAPLQAIEPHLLLVFAPPSLLAHPDLTSRLRVAFPTAELVGCSTGGEISSQGCHEQSLLLTAIAFENPGMRIISTRVAHADDAREAGERLGNALRPLGVRSVLCFVPGSGINGAELIQALTRSLPGAKVAGGMAGFYSAGENACTLHNLVIAADQIVAIGFSNSRLTASVAIGPAANLMTADVPEGATAAGMHAAALLDDATDVVQAIASAGNEPGLVLLVSDMQRKATLVAQRKDEIATVTGTLGDRHVYAGFYACAQISADPATGKAALYRHGLSVCVLREA